MTNDIINLFPSQKLKDKIRETGHVFTDTELLYIISMYAPSFDKKLEMLSRFAEIASPEVADAAHRFIRWYKDHFNAFCDNSGSSVIYELKIWECASPNSEPDIEIICSSYNAALKAIDAYYKEFEDCDAFETDKALYKIVKRPLITDATKDDEYFPIYLGECWLGAGKVLLEADDDSVPYDFSDADDSISPYNAYYMGVPDFLCNRDVVLYESGNKVKRYGVILEHKPEQLCNYLYAVPLDSEYVKHHDFGEAWRDHNHPYVHGTILVTPDDLPEEMRENYFAFMKYLDKHPEA